MIKSNLKPMEALRKEIEKYKPEIGDEVWSFDSHNCKVIGPYLVNEVVNGGAIVVVSDKDTIPGTLPVKQVAQTRGMAALLAGEFYKKQLLIARCDLGRMEYEIDKFCSKEGIL